MYKLKWRVAKVQKVVYFINEERAEPMNLRGDEFPVFCSSELMGQKNPVKWEKKNVHTTEVTFGKEEIIRLISSLLHLQFLIALCFLFFFCFVFCTWSKTRGVESLGKWIHTQYRYISGLDAERLPLTGQKLHICTTFSRHSYVYVELRKKCLI